MRIVRLVAPGTHRYFLVLVFLVLFGPVLASQSGGGFPLIVKNPASVARAKEPVSSGLAVPLHSGWKIPTGIRLYDAAGAQVPVQFKVLSRWFGPREDTTRDIKWVLVSFLADVPAAGQSTYYLNVGNGPAGNLVVSETPAEVSVSTGTAVFTIDKTTFSFVKSMNAGSVPVSGGAGQVDLLLTAGVLGSVTLTSTVLEENGSVRAVVRQKGTIPALGLEFTCRLFFWSDKSEFDVEFRLENNQAYGEIAGMGSSTHNAHFEDLSLSLKLNGAATEIRTPSSAYTPGTSLYRLIQGYSSPNSPLEMLSGFFFTETLGTQVLSTGNRHDGSMALNRTDRGIAIAVDRFWQNYPKAFTAQGNKVSLGLFPANGNGPVFTGQYGSFVSVPTQNPAMSMTTMPTYPGVIDQLSTTIYRLEGGRWKTHRFRVAVKGGSGFTTSETASLAARVNTPLVFHPAALEWPFRTYAFGEILVERKPWTNVASQRYERMMDVLATDTAADFQSTLGKIGFPAFRNRGGTYGGGQFFGWENFGDIVWGDGYSSLHYDIPFSLLINYFRTGEYSFFDVGRDMVAHRRDYDQYHSRDSGDPKRGGQWYEKGWTHGNFTDPQMSHTWVHGLLLNYVLTGDEGSREAALEVGAFIIRQNPQNWSGYWGERILGWALEGLCNLYQYLGDDNYRTVAQATAHRWVQLETQQGGHGYVINYGYASNPHTQPWMHSIVMNALGKYHLMTHDTYILPAMDRMAQWMIQSVVHTYPSGPMNARTIGKIWGDWSPTFNGDLSVHHVWGFVQALGWASVCLDNYGYYQVARDFWQSVARYHQVPTSATAPRNYNDPQTWSVIAYRMQQFPNSESKIHGNIGLWGHVMVALDWIWTGL